MMQQDWREALGALLPDTPAADVPQDAEPAPGQETETARLDVVVERKGRGGKTATIVAGFTVSDEAVAEIASQLKRRLGFTDTALTRNQDALAVYVYQHAVHGNAGCQLHVQPADHFRHTR